MTLWLLAVAALGSAAFTGTAGAATTTDTHAAAPVHDERGTLIAAIALTPATPAAAAAVAGAGRMVTALIRDGVW